MIAKLTGIVDSTGEGWLVLDVGGVGYLVFCSGRTLSRFTVGAAASLLIETVVRDNAIQLYGFAQPLEREWFRLLTTIQGVAAKGALAILSALATDELIRAIAAGDRSLITRAPGIGPKIASRIVSELRDKAGAASLGSGFAPSAGSGAYLGGEAGDAVSALVNLGFAPADALSAVSHAAARLGSGAGIEALIRGGLAELTPGEHRP